MKIDYAKSTLQQNLLIYGTKIGIGILMYANTKAHEINAYMKLNRPWRDRTGAAKMMLSTTVTDPSPDIVRIVLSHGVWYGVHLEFAREKKYAIINPTINKFTPILMDGVQNIFDIVLHEEWGRK